MHSLNPEEGVLWWSGWIVGHSESVRGTATRAAATDLREHYSLISLAPVRQGDQFRGLGVIRQSEPVCPASERAVNRPEPAQTRAICCPNRRGPIPTPAVKSPRCWR